MAIARITLELFQFMLHRRHWWMIPIVVGLLLVGLFVIIAQATPLGPFIYSLI
jgi:hypothetical protein